MSDEQIDWVEMILERLPTEYRTSINLQTWIASFQTEANELEDILSFIIDNHHLDNATYTNLDNLGDIIGESRAFDGGIIAFGMEGVPTRRGYIELDDNAGTGTVEVEGVRYPVDGATSGDPGITVGDMFFLRYNAVQNSIIGGVPTDYFASDWFQWNGSAWIIAIPDTYPDSPYGGFGDDDNIGQEEHPVGQFADGSIPGGGTTSFILPDPIYRRVLKTKIYQNTSASTRDDIINSSAILFDVPVEDVTINEDYDGRFVNIHINDRVTQQMKVIATGLKSPLPRPHGIRFIFFDLGGPF